ncbi:MAG: methyltransferase domain-containing protein [Betaproteobacteria bacterium]|nr:methyltransferase domain-containing protein [Betaproteobacteria bacterium]
MPETVDDLAAYYARRASEYERIYAKPERQSDLSALRGRIGGMFAGRSVLELACGTGWWTPVIAQGAARVTAVDLNEEVLAIARTKDLPAGKVEFVHGSAFEIPDFGRRHDALFAGFWWSHVRLEELDAFLASAVAALAPRALIAFLDNRYVEGSSTPVSRRDAQGNAYQQRRLSDGSTHEVLKNFPEPGELIRRASACGWGAHVELLEHYWMLSFWAPR